MVSLPDSSASSRGETERERCRERESGSVFLLRVIDKGRERVGPATKTLAFECARHAVTLSSLARLSNLGVFFRGKDEKVRTTF